MEGQIVTLGKSDVYKSPNIAVNIDTAVYCSRVVCHRASIQCFNTLLLQVRKRCFVHHSNKSDISPIVEMKHKQTGVAAGVILANESRLMPIIFNCQLLAISA